MIESIRKSGQAVLLLDCGAVFDSQKDRAEVILEAMELMGYDALNLGSTELFFGKGFLEHTRSHVSFPYVASNLLADGGTLPGARQYVIKEVGGIRVAILGVFDPDDLVYFPSRAREHVQGLQAISPEAALAKLVPEVKEKADLVVLLSLLGAKTTHALVTAVAGIDVAISSGSDDNIYFSRVSGASGASGSTVLLQPEVQGRTLGLVKISRDEKGVLSVGQRKRIPLGSSVPNNGEIARLVEKYKTGQEERVQQAQKEQAEKARQTEKELMEGLKLTPYEFIERYEREQTEKGKGEPR